MQPPEVSVSYPAHPSFNANARARISRAVCQIARLWLGGTMTYLFVKSFCGYKEEALQALSSVFPACTVP